MSHQNMGKEVVFPETTNYRNGGSGGDRNTLYFAAGIYFYFHGLFGSLTVQS
jgi:hypothetical protein